MQRWGIAMVHNSRCFFVRDWDHRWSRWLGNPKYFKLNNNKWEKYNTAKSDRNCVKCFMCFQFELKLHWNVCISLKWFQESHCASRSWLLITLYHFLEGAILHWESHYFLVSNDWGSWGFLVYYTEQKMKFSIKDFFSKSDQVMGIWSRLLKKFLMENFLQCIAGWVTILGQTVFSATSLILWRFPNW